MAMLRSIGSLVQKLRGIEDKVRRNPVVKSGFLAGATYPDGTSVPVVAMANEFGDPAHGRPPRPFFRNMIQAHKSEWAPEVGRRLLATDYDAFKTLSQMGLLMQSQIQDSIRELRDPPLSPRTIARKGFDKPLIDTGHMLNSASYEVDKGST